MSDFESELTNTPPPEYRVQMRVAWILMAIVGVLAVVPVLGFLSWLIAFPMMLVAFIMTIIVFSKGGVTPGLILLGCQLIVMPILIIVGPFLASFIGVGGGVATVAAVATPSDSGRPSDTTLTSLTEGSDDPSASGRTTELPPELEQLKRQLSPQQPLLMRFKSDGVAREGPAGLLLSDEKADLAARRAVQQENLFREEVFRQVAKLTNKTGEEVAAEFARLAGAAQP